MRYLFFLLFTVLNFAQEKATLMTYEVTYNTELPTTKNGYLYISNDQKKTIYYTENINKNNESKEENIDVALKFESGKKQFNYFDYQKDTLITRDDILKESVLIKEMIPDLYWNLLDETITTNNVVLNKATCYFRGRNYIAYYSTNIPIKAGPWKFQGLPGVIYTISDETKRYNWVLKKIESTEYNFSSEMSNTEAEIISIKEYAKRKFSSQDLDEKIISRLPRGVKIVDQKTFRTGFEIKFEWEE
ncbi:GLPGLI family protein [Flavobacterium jejuense]|uniref:GLPGLI family protein n=1 Tax=Flavobacterium jejuense TaxID=1544455 RepID=A0ABX0IU38_9FLAO|nr:GLPGLI family protein [Flavobacterium jejuense]NHN26344.1 GLPGLI family protein [Flavobacterium jejuense]